MQQNKSSLADSFRELPLAEKERRLALLTPEQAEQILYDWEFWAREEQKIPIGNWSTWLLLAGRGFGKTRCGSAFVINSIKYHRYVNIIGPTSGSVRDVMIEGDSGILACCDKWIRPVYKSSSACLQWPNGAKTLVFSAEEPDRLRGPQHEALWMDELAAWQYPEETYNQAMFGLRLGKNPRCLITTTPRPLPIIKSLIANPSTHVTRGSTYDNKTNLSNKFFEAVISKYEGTRLGRQELNAEILDDNPRALWTLSNIDQTRVKESPGNYMRVVVAIDPNTKNRDLAILNKSSDTTDEAGIVVVGSRTEADGREHYYVLADYSVDDGPNVWSQAAVNAYHKFGADRIVAEINNGGSMVEMVIRAVDQNVSYKEVTATRGKMLRAEPIAALYEQGRCHHVGFYAKMEDEMTTYDAVTVTKSPNRLDALVWAITELSANSSGGMLDFLRTQADGAHKPPTYYSTPTVVTGWPEV